MTKRIVLIEGNARTISVYRLAKNVWVVVGDYMGDEIRVQGRTEEQGRAALVRDGAPEGQMRQAAARCYGRATTRSM
jgi:hypothetical protein